MQAQPSRQFETSPAVPATASSTAARLPAPAQELSFRRLTTFEALTPLEELQQLAFGFPDREITSAAQLLAIAHAGGLIVGAYDGRDRMVGFSTALLARDRQSGGLYLHSDLAAIHPDCQSRSLGFALKLEQRRLALLSGFDEIRWTYDPMETRNANLNLRKLGARVIGFHSHLYGDIKGGLSRGLPSHRFLVSWNLKSGLGGERWDGVPCALSAENGLPQIHISAGGFGSAIYRCQLPLNFQSIKQSDMPLAAEWQEKLCRVSAALLREGYRGTGFSINNTQGAGEYYFRKGSAA